MPDPIPIRCKCGASPATNQVVHAGLGFSEYFCDECHTRENWQFGPFAEGMEPSPCVWCGQPSVCGGTHPSGALTGLRQPFRWMCMTCFTEQNILILSKLKTISALPDLEQSKAFETIIAEVESHMVRFAAGRKV